MKISKREPAELTPEQQAAFVRRGRRSQAATAYLMVALFGWQSPELITEGYGEERVAASGRNHFVKGWYGINPSTGERDLFPYAIASDVNASRRVIDAMGARGYAFQLYIPPTGRMEVFFANSKFQSTSIEADEDSNEPLAICETACLALKRERGER